MRDGTTTGNIGYMQYPIPGTNPAATQDFVGAFYRIHEVETIVADAAPGCQMVDATDQIGCLVAEDPCSIGFAGRTAQSWASRPNGFAGTNTDPAGTWDVSALRVAGLSPIPTRVQQFLYPLSRKLYFNTLTGFGNIASTTGDQSAYDELTLAKNEATPTFIKPILTSLGFISLGPNGPLGTDTPFCEDFNEATICGSPTNVNGCAGNPAGIPNNYGSTTCGNGILEPFEECDGTVGAGTGGCSVTCRCILDYNFATDSCN